MGIQFYSRGPVEQISGGYLYNRKVIEGLRLRQLDVNYHADPGALCATNPTDTTIIDGLILRDCCGHLQAATGDVVLLLHMPIAADLPLPPQTRFVVTSPATRDHLCAQSSIAASRITVIEPGVPVEWLQRRDYRSRATRLLFLANYLPGKGHKILLRALRDLLDLPWTISMYGNRDFDASYFGDVVDEIDKFGLLGRVQARGTVPHEDIFPLMQNVDLLLQLSQYESYSMVTAEAIACGLPVLSTRTGNWQAFETTGLVRYLDESTSAEVATALSQLIDDSALYSALRPKSEINLRSWDDVCEEFARCLEHAT